VKAVDRRLWAAYWCEDFIKVRALWFWAARWPGAGPPNTLKLARRKRPVTLWTGGVVRLPTRSHRTGEVLRWI
jgi:hypothetical protein